MADSLTTYSSDYPAGFDPQRVSVVRVIFAAMANDYGGGFTGQFKSSSKPSNSHSFDWKCRLLELSKPYTDEQLLNAVDNCCRRSTKFAPTLRELEAEMSAIKQNESNSQRNNELFQKLHEMPDPVGLARIQELRDMAASLRENKKPYCDGDHDEFLHRFAEHEAMVAPFSLAAHRLVRHTGGDSRYQNRDLQYAREGR